MKNIVKKAYSLAELMIVMCIVAVVIVLTITLTRPTKYILGMQYIKALNVLETASYNLYEDGSEKYTDFTRLTKNKNQFCQILTRYINVTVNECQAENPYFVTSNDQIFYFSDSLTYGYQDFRIVWIDLNGKRKPNTNDVSDRRLPDIVPFAVSNNGEVTPLGMPIYEKTYIKARVVFPDEKKSEIMTFLDAQAIAFGENYFANDAYSLNLDNIKIKNVSKELKTNIKSEFTQSESCIPQTSNRKEQKEYSRCTVEIF